MANIKSNIIKWLAGSGKKETDVKGPSKKQSQTPSKKKPVVRQRADGRWAVKGSPKKTYGSKSAATKAANKATAAAAAAKRAEEAAKLKKNLGKGLGVLTVAGLGTGVAFSGSDKKDDKNKDQGPTIRMAKKLKLPAPKPVAKKPVAKKPVAEKPVAKVVAKPVAKKPVAEKPVAKKPVAKVVAKPVAKKPVPKKLKSFEQGVRYVDTPFGKIKMDSTDEGMAFEEFDQKSGGQVKKRRMGGMVKKGYGKALRGY